MQNSSNDFIYDVGITGYWWSTNYGSVATYYALYRVISDMGLKTFLIDRPESATNGEGLDVFSRKFMNEYAKVSESLEWGEYEKFNDICNTFVIGSDQVWTSTSIKVYNYFFFLDFVHNDRKKISYAASFGEYFNVSEEELKESKKYLASFSDVSVREYQAVDICKKDLDKEAEWVMDPVFLLDMKYWNEIADNAQRKTKDILGEDKKYIFAYMLNPSEEKLEIINKTAENFNLPVICILDGRKGTFEKNNKILNLPNTIKNATEEEWMFFMKNAEYVVTDSHHGSALAIIFNKQFICCSNKKWGQARYESLFGLLKIKDRQNRTVQEIIDNDTFNKKINYTKLNAILSERVKSSREWLMRALGVDKCVGNKVKGSMCTGCSACESVCPYDAVSLKPDKHGYYIRNVDMKKCTNCGLCTRICPALNLPKNDNSENPELYEFIAAGDEVLYSSSSGGIFSVLANEVFRRKGSIVGAAWGDDFSVEHVIIDSPDELYKLKKSKYAQSRMGDTFKTVKSKLDSGEFVMFTGTPCQVTGLKAFLRKDYDNLILVDILCGNAPSAMFFKKYIEEAYPDGIKSYQFRYKSENVNWNCRTVKVEDNNGKEIILSGSKDDDFQRVYHSHIICSEHCEKCRYQTLPRFGDITIGDFWGIEKKERPYNVEKGVSAVLLNNPKGKAFFEALPKDEISISNKVPLEWLGRNGWALDGSKNFASPHRDKFYQAILDMPFSKAVDYAVKPNVLRNMPSIEENPSMIFNTALCHFKFDPNVWIETVKGSTVFLYVKPEQSRKGKFACLPFLKSLDKEKTYHLKLKFKIKTDHNFISFHIKDSVSYAYQVIKSFNHSKNLNEKWTEVDIKFKPNSKIYDEFMITASQIKGDGAYIAFEYIYIVED